MNFSQIFGLVCSLLIIWFLFRASNSSEMEKPNNTSLTNTNNNPVVPTQASTNSLRRGSLEHAKELRREYRRKKMVSDSAKAVELLSPQSKVFVCHAEALIKEMAPLVKFYGDKKQKYRFYARKRELMIVLLFLHNRSISGDVPFSEFNPNLELKDTELSYYKDLYDLYGEVREAQKNSV